MKTAIAMMLTLGMTGAVFTGLVQATPGEDRDVEAAMNSEYTANSSAADAKQRFNLQQVIAMVQAERGGDVLEAEMEHERGRRVFEVEGVDADGRRYEVYLDASDGSLLKEEYK